MSGNADHRAPARATTAGGLPARRSCDRITAATAARVGPDEKDAAIIADQAPSRRDLREIRLDDPCDRRASDVDRASRRRRCRAQPNHQPTTTYTLHQGTTLIDRRCSPKRLRIRIRRQQWAGLVHSACGGRWPWPRSGGLAVAAGRCHALRIFCGTRTMCSAAPSRSRSGRHERCPRPIAIRPHIVRPRSKIQMIGDSVSMVRSPSLQLVVDRDGNVASLACVDHENHHASVSLSFVGGDRTGRRAKLSDGSLCPSDHAVISSGFATPYWGACVMC
jgi:hypothetical protein